MSRLPARLQPLWPLAKQMHLTGARAAGRLGRSRFGGSGVPGAGTSTSGETLAADGSVGRVVLDPPGVVRRAMPVGEPQEQWYFRAHLAEPDPGRFVLELADGRLVGRHVAVVSRDGVLDGETSHYFGVEDWRQHPVFWQVRPPAPEIVDGTVAALSARATGDNYYHFIIDALPRLGMLEEAHPGLRPDVWVVDRRTRYQRELLALAGFDPAELGGRVVEPDRHLALQAKRLLVPSLPNAGTLVTPATTRWLQDRLPARAVAGRPERLYVTRGTAPNTRRVVQDAEIRSRLERRGFVAIDPGSLSVQEQIDHFAAARVVVAPHGAALTNLTFCRPGVRVLELFSSSYLNGGFWSITSNIADSRYRFLVSEGRRPHRPGRIPLHFMDDIDVTADQVEHALDALLED